MEPLTEQAVYSMIRSLDRYDSLVSLSPYAVKEQFNDPLHELAGRFPSLFDRSMSLELQEKLIQLLLSYISSPLNNHRLCSELFNAMVEAATHSSRDTSMRSYGIRLMLSSVQLRRESSPPSPKPPHHTFLVQLLGLLDVQATCEIIREVKARSEKLQRDRKRRQLSASSSLQAVQSFFGLLLCETSSSIPCSVLVKELQNLSPSKEYFQAFVSPFTSFVTRSQLLVNFLSISNRRWLFPVVGYSLVNGSLWNLDRKTLEFSAPSGISFASKSADNAENILQYLIEQAHSRHTYQLLLGISKQGSTMERTSEGLEDQLVAVMLKSMPVTDEKVAFPKWRKISSHLTTMGAPGFVNFRTLVGKLEESISSFSPSEVETGRYYLLWSIYQFVSVQTNIRCSELVPCLSLVSLLFPEAHPLPVPDLTSSGGVVRLGPAYTWSHLVRRARDEEVAVPWNTPLALSHMLDFVLRSTDKAVQALTPAVLNTPEHAAAVNCFVNLPPLRDNQIRVSKMDYADKMANSLLEPMLDSSFPSASQQLPSPTVMAAGNVPVFNALLPLSMDILDVLSCHVRMMLANNVQPCFTKVILSSREAPTTVFLSPAFWETNARLMMYEETDTITHQYIGLRLPELASKNNAPFILISTFELLSFRTPYVAVNWKGNILLISAAMNQQYNVAIAHPRISLYICQTMLRLIQSFNVDDFIQPRSHLAEIRLYAAESEELTRLMLLKLVHLMHIIGLDQSTIHFLTTHFTAVQHVVPHAWSAHIVATFPQPLIDLYATFVVPGRPDKKQLVATIENLANKLRTVNSDADVQTVYKQMPGPPFILSLVFRQILSNEASNSTEHFKGGPLVAQVMEKMQVKIQMAAVRLLLDYMTTEGSRTPMVALSGALSSMIWKYNLLPLDRVILVALLRPTENVQEAQLLLALVQSLLQNAEFASRINETLALLPPMYWQCSDYLDRLYRYHQKFAEPFYFNGSFDPSRAGVINHPRFPLYFSNVVLRTLPLVDVLVHRCLDLGSAGHRPLDAALDFLGPALSYHDRPVTVTWQTLFFYDTNLHDNLPLKVKLVQTFIGHKAQHYPPNFYFTPHYHTYMNTEGQLRRKMPDEYFSFLMDRLVTCMNGEAPLEFDWRFHEYPNAVTHLLYMSCVELMTIMGSAEDVVAGLLPTLTNTASSGSEGADMLQKRLNCLALCLSAMPGRFFAVLLHLLQQVLTCNLIQEGVPSDDVLDFLDSLPPAALDEEGGLLPAWLLHLVHAVALHNGVAHTLTLVDYLRSSLLSSISTVQQFLFLLKTICPLLPKLTTDSGRLAALTLDLFTALRRVTAAAPPTLKQIILICDLFFFIFDTNSLEVRKEKVAELVQSLPVQFHDRLMMLTQSQSCEKLALRQ
ncbi:hypothetical protein RvY_17010 [Ramazzottius varieornatus]|uniref:Mediator of RNA polymerase II transcription subunit 23 n=1 Tax=Ramazzottius varieornatus TaxID=947166 RepID=A0A1D1W6S1_RAMVA|nr:hypothetical protein RvY_17010 [Ramazzottius varieornatus]